MESTVYKMNILTSCCVESGMNNIDAETGCSLADSELHLVGSKFIAWAFVVSLQLKTLTRWVFLFS